MENTIKNLAQFTGVLQVKNYSLKKDISLSSHSNTLKADSINISQAGKDKLSKSTQADLNDKLHELANKDIDTKEDNSEMDIIDEMIKQLKERMKELQQQMAQLRLKDDEASQAKLELLELELFNLNAQLLELNERKLEMLKG